MYSQMYPYIRSSAPRFAKALLNDNKNANRRAIYGASRGHDVLDLGESWTILAEFERTDSEYVDRVYRSNAEVVTDMLLSEFPDHAVIDDWSQVIAIRVYDDNGEPTPVVSAVQDIYAQLDRYILLDEMRYSELEWKEKSESICEGIRSELRHYVKGSDLLPDDWAKSVLSELFDVINIRSWESEWLHESDVPEAIEIIIRLGFADLPALYRESLINWRDYPIVAIKTEIRDRLWTVKFRVGRFWYNKVVYPIRKFRKTRGV